MAANYHFNSSKCSEYYSSHPNILSVFHLFNCIDKMKLVHWPVMGVCEKGAAGGAHLPRLLLLYEMYEFTQCTKHHTAL